MEYGDSIADSAGDQFYDSLGGRSPKKAPTSYLAKALGSQEEKSENGYDELMDECVIDEKLWEQCKAVFPKNMPSSLPYFCGMVGEGTKTMKDADEPEPLSVYLMDGNFVKISYDMDFVEGGNGEEANWIPEEQIWIDADHALDDAPFICYHEAHEYYDMCSGMSYDKAHDRANACEKMLRMREQ